MSKRRLKKKLKACLIISPIADESTKRRAIIRKRAKYLEKQIDAALNPLGYKATLITSDNTKQWITPHMIRRLTSDPLAVAVLDGLNPNCMYEVGIRHAFCLPMLFLLEERRSGPCLPFNIHDVDAFEYPPLPASGGWSRKAQDKFRRDIQERVTGAKLAKASENFAEALDRISAVKVLRLILAQKTIELDSLEEDLKDYQKFLRKDYEVTDEIPADAARRLFDMIAASNVRVTNRNDALRELARRPELFRLTKKLDSCLLVCQKVDELSAYQADLARQLKRPINARNLVASRTAMPTRGEIDQRVDETIEKVSVVRHEIETLLKRPGL